MCVPPMSILGGRVPLAPPPFRERRPCYNCCFTIVFTAMRLVESNILLNPILGERNGRCEAYPLI